MTHTNTISNLFLEHLLSREGYGFPRDWHRFVLSFLFENDPDNPFSGEPYTPVHWEFEPELVAFYASEGAAAKVRLSPEALSVAALIGLGMPSNSKPALKFNKAAALNPIFTRVKTLLDGGDALRLAERALGDARVRAAWAFWPHADLSLIAGGDLDECAKVASMELSLRIEAATLLIQSELGEAGADCFSSILPELFCPYWSYSLSASGTIPLKRPLSRAAWEDSLKYRSSLLAGLISLESDTDFDPLSLIAGFRTPDEVDKFLKGGQVFRVAAWMERNMDHFPTSSPERLTDLELVKWAVRAGGDKANLDLLLSNWSRIPRGFQRLIFFGLSELWDDSLYDAFCQSFDYSYFGRF